MTLESVGLMQECFVIPVLKFSFCPCVSFVQAFHIRFIKLTHTCRKLLVLDRLVPPTRPWNFLVNTISASKNCHIWLPVQLRLWKSFIYKNGIGKQKEEFHIAQLYNKSVVRKQQRKTTNLTVSWTL